MLLCTLQRHFGESLRLNRSHSILLAKPTDQIDLSASASSMATWSEAQEDSLIQLVEDRPPLYDITERAYSDKVTKARLWREVEEHLHMSEKDIRQRWASLRTQYSRYKKQSGAGRTMRQNWILSRLQFLEPHTKTRESQPNLTSQEDAIQTDYSAVVFDDYNDGGDDNESEGSMLSTPNEMTSEAPVEMPADPPPSPPVPIAPRPLKRRRQGGEESTEESAAAATMLGVLAQTLTRLNQPKPRDRVSSYLAALDDQIRYLSPPMQTMFMCDIQKRYSEIVMQEELFGYDCK